MNFESRRICSTLLLFVTIIGLMMSFGENMLCAGELPGTHDTVSSAHEQEMSQMCPSAPSSSDSPNDHFCVDDCGCPCQAPLTSSAMTFTHSRSFTYLYPTEISLYTPEVYLSLFVPPDSASA